MVNLSPRTAALSIEDALHLLRRATLHPTWAHASALVGQSPAGAIESLLGVNPPIPMPDWADDPPEFGSFQDAARLWPELQNWWIGHCIGKSSLREKMMALWHNHFTSDYITVYAAMWNTTQSTMMRNNVYSFKEIATRIIGDPAMLRYLNGEQSVKGNPNENFAREWFELFTLGVGNYTENDIVEASRAFTGWRISGLTGLYNNQLADLGEKTILGQTGNWEYGDVVRITLEQPACAKWLAKRLVRYFVEYYPDEETIEQVAELIRTNNYELRNVIGALLSSEYFYSTSLRGALIKSPLELVVGLASAIGLTTLGPTYPVSVMSGLTQIPFYPPTVEGWKGHRLWINSTLFPARQRFAESFIDGRQIGSSTKLMDANNQPLTIDLVSLVKQMPDSTEAEKIVENVCKLLLPVSTSESQRAILLDIMMAGAPAYTWDIDSGTAPSRLKLLMQAIVRMPEFQLT
jgi:uncharacterized protein (DUF1800 family)